LGVVVDPGVSHATLLRHITNREKLLSKNENDDTLATIRDNSPRPYPTVRPVAKDARANHARYVRVFETSMLCFDVKHCDCCGITVPYHNDPQQQKLASNKDHTFRRTHLVKKFHDAWFCACNDVCLGGQYYGANKTKEIDWFRVTHFSILLKHGWVKIP
jgi:hypothetical protein